VKIELKHPYGRGYVDGRHDAEATAAISAFGAIRRAAELARAYDKEASDYDYQVYWLWQEYQQTAEFEKNVVKDAKLCAHTIRRAIRLAIGSEKA
jgi:hypothetical protein